MGHLIVIEGLDGSGKATQAKLLAERLQRNGKKIRLVNFPNYASPSSSLVKMYLEGEFGDKPGDVNAYAASSFYAVDRYASFKKDWHDDYENGIIIADRYTTSNAIHQCSKLPESEWDSFLHWLFEFEYKRLGIPEPDLVVFLKVDTDMSQKLMAERYHGEDKRDIHERDLKYLERCQAAADHCIDRLEWHVVRCCRDGHMRSIEAIGDDIADIVQSYL